MKIIFDNFDEFDDREVVIGNINSIAFINKLIKEELIDKEKKFGIFYVSSGKVS